METNELPSPFITAKQLNAYLHKSVTVAGRAVSVTDSTLILDGGDQGKVTVARAQPSQVMIEQGMNMMVRGFVNQDLSVAESKNFPASDLGEKFGTSAAFVLDMFLFPLGGFLTLVYPRLQTLFVACYFL